MGRVKLATRRVRRGPPVPGRDGHRGGRPRRPGAKARGPRPAWRQRLNDSRGQGTVEFAVVCAAFISIVVALGALWQALQGGLFVDHALASASHHLQSVSAGAVGDVFLY